MKILQILYYFMYINVNVILVQHYLDSIVPIIKNTIKENSNFEKLFF